MAVGTLPTVEPSNELNPSDVTQVDPSTSMLEPLQLSTDGTSTIHSVPSDSPHGITSPLSESPTSPLLKGESQAVSLITLEVSEEQKPDTALEVTAYASVQVPLSNTSDPSFNAQQETPNSSNIPPFDQKELNFPSSARNNSIDVG